MTFQAKHSIISAPGANDILCGRCKTAFNHVGNKKFRRVIAKELPQYVKGKSKMDKSLMIISTVHMLKEDLGCRFLKQKGDSYVELSDKEARAKVGHAFRDLAASSSAATPSNKKPQQKRQPVAAKKNKKTRSRQVTRQSFDLGRLDEDVFGLEVESLDDLFQLCKNAALMNSAAENDHILAFDQACVPLIVPSSTMVNDHSDLFPQLNDLELQDLQAFCQHFDKDNDIQQGRMSFSLKPSKRSSLGPVVFVAAKA